MRGIFLVFLGLLVADLNQVCPERIENFPRWFWYKPIGSYRFSRADPRRYYLSVILGAGAQVDQIPSCVWLLDPAGEKIARVGWHSRKGFWIARFYGPSGCGPQAPQSLSGKINGCQLLKRLRDRGFSTNHVWAKFGRTCVKIPDVTKCGRTSTDPQCRHCKCEGSDWKCNRHFP